MKIRRMLTIYDSNKLGLLMFGFHRLICLLPEEKLPINFVDHVKQY